MYRPSLERPCLINTTAKGNEDNPKLQKTVHHAKNIENNQLISITEENNDKRDKNRQKKHRLTGFESCLFAKILENSLTEINIIDENNIDIKIKKALSDLPLFFTMKYELDPSDATKISRVQNIQNANDVKLRKYEADRKYFTEVIEGTYMYLYIRKDYKILTDKISDVLNREQDRNYLYEQEAKNKLKDYKILTDKISDVLKREQDRNYLYEQVAKNKLLRRELFKQLRHQRNYIKTVVYDTNATINNLMWKFQDYTLNAEMQHRYINNWQRARTEQNYQSIYDKESHPLGLIEHYKQRIEQEQRVHSDVVLLMNIAIDETSVKVEEWMNKYDVNIEEIDLEIQFKRNNYQAAYERRMGLEETLAKHNELMMEWKQFKAERERARKYIADMTKSAIIVQAWWRGLLVRKKLGPYKEKQKKRGDKKKQ